MTPHPPTSHYSNTTPFIPKTCLGPHRTTLSTSNLLTLGHNSLHPQTPPGLEHSPCHPNINQNHNGDDFQGHKQCCGWYSGDWPSTRWLEGKYVPNKNLISSKLVLTKTIYQYSHWGFLYTNLLILIPSTLGVCACLISPTSSGTPSGTLSGD
ncbi:hypothetical protein F5J12DRAFT_779653 [Pisolithus orientalis]|uniref:uncharacterized protein n=1 Tax=Pisolithus orientalis TaxID=936130 RepID=UPI002224B394|nr:uncharacterized protein F5J12DRAFT_779653 [Pisolithus orientalis]KAI6030512.1 hypothetical protein F5J12DRAFT_779653 [Pisolithus orientalis]